MKKLILSKSKIGKSRFHLLRDCACCGTTNNHFSHHPYGFNKNARFYYRLCLLCADDISQANQKRRERYYKKIEWRLFRYVFSVHDGLNYSSTALPVNKLEHLAPLRYKRALKVLAHIERYGGSITTSWQLSCVQIQCRLNLKAAQKAVSDLEWANRISYKSAGTGICIKLSEESKNA